MQTSNMWPTCFEIAYVAFQVCVFYCSNWSAYIYTFRVRSSVWKRVTCFRALISRMIHEAFTEQTDTQKQYRKEVASLQVRLLCYVNIEWQAALQGLLRRRSFAWLAIWDVCRGFKFGIFWMHNWAAVLPNIKNVPEARLSAHHSVSELYNLRLLVKAPTVWASPYIKIAVNIYTLSFGHRITN